jgi:hypothetical protein
MQFIHFIIIFEYFVQNKKDLLHFIFMLKYKYYFFIKYFLYESSINEQLPMSHSCKTLSALFIESFSV